MLPNKRELELFQAKFQIFLKVFNAFDKQKAPAENADAFIWKYNFKITLG